MHVDSPSTHPYVSCHEYVVSLSRFQLLIIPAITWRARWRTISFSSDSFALNCFQDRYITQSWNTEQASRFFHTAHGACVVFTVDQTTFLVWIDDHHRHIFRHWNRWVSGWRQSKSIAWSLDLPSQIIWSIMPVTANELVLCLLAVQCYFRLSELCCKAP